MIKKTFTLIAVLFLCCSAFADRQLDRSEVLEIFDTLTQTPRKAWIPIGTIQATHQEYRTSQTTDANHINARIAEKVQAYQNNPDKRDLTAELQTMKLEVIPFNVRYKLSNKYTMGSTVTVKVDGEKFYWQIDVDSRSDLVKPAPDLAGNFLTEEFDLSCNEKRVFAWNGQSYINYFRPLNHVTIEPERFPVNGPLTAGVIPWGYGRYTLQGLIKASSSATQIGTEIYLTIQRANGQEMFVLDLAKDLALLQYSSVKQDGRMRVQVYGGYQSINGKWYPGTLLIEEYDTGIEPQRLLARDIWNYTSISLAKPDDFSVQYEYDAFIEDFTFSGDKPLQYRYSAPEPLPISKVNTNELKMERLEFTSAGSKQNCATASLKYVCDKLGIKCSWETLSQLVHGKEKMTTLAEMQQFVQSRGLEANAVKTNVEMLTGAHDYQVIVHLPGQNHFVVLGDIDSEYVRLIDLSSNTFYYLRTIDWFNSTWDGTALLVSKNFVKLDYNSLKKIFGAEDCGEQCNTSCSSAGESPCSGSPPFCGSHTIRYSRTCCGSSASGSCSESSMVYKIKESCSEDIISGDCEGDGDWTSFFMSACG